MFTSVWQQVETKHIIDEQKQATSIWPLVFSFTQLVKGDHLNRMDYYRCTIIHVSPLMCTDVLLMCSDSVLSQPHPPLFSWKGRSLGVTNRNTSGWSALLLTCLCMRVSSLHKEKLFRLVLHWQHELRWKLTAASAFVWFQFTSRWSVATTKLKVMCLLTLLAC